MYRTNAITVLARLEGQIAFELLLSRLPRLTLDTERVEWRHNLGLRGVRALPVMFEASEQRRKSSLESDESHGG